MKNLFRVASMLNMVYFDQSGQARSSQTGAAASADTVETEMQSCGGGSNVYRAPDQFTLRADNSAGVAPVIFKFPSFDNVVEAIQGTIGADFFSVLEFPNGAGTVAQQAGGNIFGAQSLARITATWCIKVYKVQASNDAVASLAQFTVNGFYGNIQGVDRMDLTMNLDKNLSVSANTLSLTKAWNFTSNFAMAATVPTGTTLDLTFYILGYEPYTTLIKK